MKTFVLQLAILLGLLVSVCAQGARSIDELPMVMEPVDLEVLREAVLPNEFWKNPRGNLKVELEKHLTTLADWGKFLEKSNTKILCIGEKHTDHYRKAIASEILGHLNVGKLFVEQTKTEAAISVDIYRKTGEVDILGASAKEVFSQMQINNKLDQIAGIERTKKQNLYMTKEKLSSPVSQVLSRDGFIAFNFVNEMSLTGLNVVLYGAQHCSLNDINLGHQKTFFRHVHGKYGSLAAKNVKIVLASGDDPLKGTLQRAGLGQRSFVIADVSKINLGPSNHREELDSLKRNFSTLIYIKDR